MGKRKQLARLAMFAVAIACFSNGNGKSFAAEDSSYVAAESLSEENVAAGEEAFIESAGETVRLALLDFDSQVVGTYVLVNGWVRNYETGTDTEAIYNPTAEDAAVSGKSIITCSYMETNYSIQDYEQLRSWLLSNLSYANLNAQLTTSAGYTEDRDYLYIVVVDESDVEYRDIYFYVVGNYRCFCVQVAEYREEAALASLDASCLTPEEAGKEMAESFVWNS